MWYWSVKTKVFDQNSDKAEVLNIQFQSVFNNNFSIIRDVKSDNIGKLYDFIITETEGLINLVC